MPTVTTDREPFTTTHRPPLRQRVRTHARTAYRFAHADIRTQLDCERRGARGLRAVAAFIALRWVLPAIVRPLQSTRWCIRWRIITDSAVRARYQVGSMVWVGLWSYLLGPHLYTAALLLPGIVFLAFGVGRLRYPNTIRGAARGRFQPEGFAGWDELRTTVSAHAVRLHASETRPAIERKATPRHASRPSAWRLCRVSPHECGTWVGNTAIGPPFPVRCYTPHENGILIIGPPRSIKTRTQTHQVANWPDALICLQTKASTYKDTWPIRAAISATGRVELIDPEGLTGRKSTFRWALQRGCRDPKVAAERAGALVTASVEMGKEDGPWLSSQANLLLRAFLLIADVAGKTMREVHEWATSPAAASSGALALMREHANEIPKSMIKAVSGALANEATRTRGAVFYALGEAVGFMADPAAAELCCPGPDEPQFDVRQFLADRGTVYLIATDRAENKIGPLLSAFTSYVVEEAKRLAGPLERESLEPGLHVSGDESANTIPLDLPRLYSDSGGRHIQICASVQSRSQLRTRFGEEGAETVENSAGTVLWAGGITADADLESISKHSGTRLDLSLERPERVPVLTFAEARRVPKSHGVLIHGSMTATIVRIPPPWRRPDIIAARVKGHAADAADAMRQMVVDQPPKNRPALLTNTTTQRSLT